MEFGQVKNNWFITAVASFTRKRTSTPAHAALWSYDQKCSEDFLLLKILLLSLKG